MRFTFSAYIKQISPNAVLPKRATDGSAAYDIFLPADLPKTIVLSPLEKVTFSLGFAIWVRNHEWCMVIMPRSGTGKRGLHLANVLGLIDSDYQGEVQLVLRNASDTDWLTIDTELAVAQAVFLPVGTPQFTLVSEFEAETARGAGGFGSTDAPNTVNYFKDS
jgi:dUTP pyrophosphatase